jgi:hypothetical protein
MKWQRRALERCNEMPLKKRTSSGTQVRICLREERREALESRYRTIM